MQRLSAVEVAELLGTDAYNGGIMDPRGGNIHPLNFALGLADAAIAVGAKVYGQTKVETVSTGGPLHTITSMHGRVRARKVLVCTNGYTDDLIPGLRQSVVPIRSVQVATAPLSDNLRASILSGLHAPSDIRRCYRIFVLTRQAVLPWEPVGPIRPMQHKRGLLRRVQLQWSYFPSWPM